MSKETKDGVVEILGSAIKWFVVWIIVIYCVAVGTGQTVDAISIATLAAAYTVAQGVATTAVVIMATLAVGFFE